MYSCTDQNLNLKMQHFICICYQNLILMLSIRTSLGHNDLAGVVLNKIMLTSWFYWLLHKAFIEIHSCIKTTNKALMNS